MTEPMAAAMISMKMVNPKPNRWGGIRGVSGDEGAGNLPETGAGNGPAEFGLGRHSGPDPELYATVGSVADAAVVGVGTGGRGTPGKSLLRPIGVSGAITRSRNSGYD